MKLITEKTLIIFGAFTLIALVTFFMVYQLITTQKNEKELSQKQVVQEAKAHFQSMVDARSWNAQYGGVYVKPVNGIKPNPYLKNNTLETKGGETLVKINPAWMTRQISQIANKQGDYHYKITSLKPLNPSNKADYFESQALKYFAINTDQKYFYQFTQDDESFDFMGALVTKRGCLKCHAHQGYKVGDIRGGIRVSIPLEHHKQRMNFLQEKTEYSVMIVLALAVIISIIFSLLINLLFQHQERLNQLNEVKNDD